MDSNWDADFRDYGHGNKTRYNQQEMIVPDLASMTDEEFAKRITAMKLEHQKTLELCDSLGLHPASTSESSLARPPLPVAAVNDNYMLSTTSYCSPAGDLITTSRQDIRRPFKARKPPLRRKIEHDELTRRLSSKRKAANASSSSLREEEQMKSFMIERYLSAYNDNNTFNDNSLSDNEQEILRCSNGWPLLRPERFDNSWHPRVTVPKPFDMTIREELKPRILSRSMADFERYCEEQAKKEAQECSKKFKASPAPANIYVPLLEELSRDRERRRQLNLAKRQKELDDLQKPFAFLRREDERQARKHRRQAMFVKSVSGAPDANFKAKPFPEHIYNNDAHELIRQQELIRQEERLNRAEAMLQLSTLPPNMKKERPRHNCEMSHETGDGRCRSPTRSATGSRAEASNSPTRRCEHSMERTDRCGAEDHVFEDRRAVKNEVARWPRHSLRSSSLSRSLTDLLSASEEDEYSSFTVRGYHGSASRSALKTPSRAQTTDASGTSNRNIREVKSANARHPGHRPASSTSTSATSRRPPVPKPQLARASVGIKVGKWRSHDSTTLEERLRREIEDDLRNIDLTAN